METSLDFDQQRLVDYLTQQVSGFAGPANFRKFSVGQSNPTYLVETPDKNYVLRRKPTGPILKSAHAVDREFRVMSALQNTAVPVPTMYHLCEDDDIIGSSFYLMSFVEGRSLVSPALDEIPKEQRRDYFDAVLKTMAAIHSVDLQSAGLADFGRTGNYFERQFNLWSKQYRASETQLIPSMETLMVWLADNIPEDDGRLCLIHGDYKFDNVMFDKNSADVVAVMDWELSTLGHPFGDLGYFLMQARLPNTGVSFGIGDIDREAHGIPSEEECIATYCRHAGIEPPKSSSFYLIFNLFRFAAILQGIARRHLDGNASQANAKEIGELTVPIADMAVSLLEEMPA